MREAQGSIPGQVTSDTVVATAAMFRRSRWVASRVQRRFDFFDNKPGDFYPGVTLYNQGCGSGSVKIPLLLQKLFDLKSNLAKRFCPYTILLVEY